jgi:hypothetical protein
MGDEPAHDRVFRQRRYFADRGERGIGDLASTISPDTLTDQAADLEVQHLWHQRQDEAAAIPWPVVQ